ncbi:uncharacterized protein LOC133736695 isoform X2 [Rosa rugosa]|uniref:uncharacterized protein LOC133736695 isoform X2 n=1 Tax=Rosa rugosa TaxID=74645 RepID=UPI002B40C5AB|nr:uncharacterized protein LOC133736695 isoform X2 [Rosa rugosa]
MKSHDYHVIMQHLLVIAIRQVLPKQVCMVLLELSSYFRHLYANNQTSEEFSQLKPRIVLTLCQMEKIFPPSFFDVMVHLTVHLAEEAALAGPVHYRSMWPFERYLGDLKDHVRNKSRPEGSIAEGYIAQECLSFCSMYLEDVDTRLTRPGRNADVNMDYKEWERLNKYVLLNCPEVKPYLSKFVRNARRRKGKRTLYQCDQASHNNFPAWFKQHVMQLNMVPDNNVHEDLYALARGPNPWCTKHKNFVINGFRFRIHRIDKKKKNQNSGVFVRSTRISYSSRHDNNPNDGIQDYYGIVKDIIELDYENDRKIVLFDCDWVNSEGNSAGLKIDLYGFILVNFNKLLQGGDTLILASQAEQVFYVQDPIEIEWHVANRTKPRDLYDLVEVVHDEPCAPQNMDDASLDVYEEVVRTDVDGIIPQRRGIFDEAVEHNEEDVADSNLDG